MRNLLLVLLSVSLMGVFGKAYADDDADADAECNQRLVSPFTPGYDGWDNNRQQGYKRETRYRYRGIVYRREELRRYGISVFDCTEVQVRVYGDYGPKGVWVSQRWFPNGREAEKWHRENGLEIPSR
jgi:hypothetical protein